ncbi:phenylalanine--tRNA ligase subunit beta [Insolitispirillum peregrinum]|uniref:phenylalanine--tRNA ligase subunit beta n=1 Tax=Insolitispirillum peregrinum TaxID=80876 RepID=UPI003612DF4E
MKFTLSWLKDHLDTIASVAEIGKTLTMIGLEIEEIIDPSSKLDGFVVGHVLTADKHPDADKLKLCTVDNGQGTLQIVCGAPNARAGLKVALATPGCVIPVSGDKLKKGKIRGVESQGMMCSTRELCLGEDHDGIIELPEDTPVGVPLASVLNIDPVFDISVTPNRADCLGVRGVARDLAAVGLGTLKADPLTAPLAGTFASPRRVQIAEDTLAACPVFVGRTIRGVKNGDSPQWLKDRLLAVGLRPISALVDITNYVTIGWGRPLHVFDADTLNGDLLVRFAQPGEHLVALNDKTYELTAEMVAVADQGKAHSIGGVMGGVDSGCTGTTTTVFLEAALFDPRRIARTARTLTLESDAKHRFERGVDPQSPVWGAELATRLILDLCGGEASELVIAGDMPAGNGPIDFRPSRVRQLVGIEVATATMIAMFERLGCSVLSTSDDLLTVQPPSWRGDIAEEHDLVEEVARLNGYDNLPVTPLPRLSMPKQVLTAQQKTLRVLTRTLAGRGLHETVTWSFLPRAQAELFGGGQPELLLANPISSDLDAMRPSILPNLATAAGRNAARGYPNVGLFEVGPQFHGGEPGDQTRVIAGLRAGKTGPRHWDERPRAVDVFDVKADVLALLKAAGVNTDSLQIVAEAPSYYHPGRSGSLRLGKVVVAQFGDLHPAVLKALDVKGPMVAFELFVERLPTPKAKATKARSLLQASAFQPLERDFAFVVDTSVAAEAMVRAARGADRQMITDVSVFDLYQGPNMPDGKKSLAVSVTLQPMEKTLTDAEIEEISGKVIAAIEKATGGSLRK